MALPNSIPTERGIYTLPVELFLDIVEDFPLSELAMLKCVNPSIKAVVETHFGRRFRHEWNSRLDTAIRARDSTTVSLLCRAPDASQLLNAPLDRALFPQVRLNPCPSFKVFEYTSTQSLTYWSLMHIKSASLLHLAISKGKADIVEELLQAGADATVNVKYDGLDLPDIKIPSLRTYEVSTAEFALGCEREGMPTGQEGMHPDERDWIAWLLLQAGSRPLEPIKMLYGCVDGAFGSAAGWLLKNTVIDFQYVNMERKPWHRELLKCLRWAEDLETHRAVRSNSESLRRQLILLSSNEKRTGSIKSYWNDDDKDREAAELMSIARGFCMAGVDLSMTVKAGKHCENWKALSSRLASAMKDCGRNFGDGEWAMVLD